MNCYPSDQQQIAVNLCPPNNLFNFFKVNSYPFRPDADRSESKSAAPQETPLSTGFDHLCGGEADKRQRCGKKFTKKKKKEKKNLANAPPLNNPAKLGRLIGDESNRIFPEAREFKHRENGSKGVAFDVDGSRGAGVAVTIPTARHSYPTRGKSKGFKSLRPKFWMWFFFSLIWHLVELFWVYLIKRSKILETNDKKRVTGKP